MILDPPPRHQENQRDHLHGLTVLVRRRVPDLRD
jgi:hypothetical protein